MPFQFGSNPTPMIPSSWAANGQQDILLDSTRFVSCEPQPTNIGNRPANQSITSSNMIISNIPAESLAVDQQKPPPTEFIDVPLKTNITIVDSSSSVDIKDATKQLQESYRNAVVSNVEMMKQGQNTELSASPLKSMCTTTGLPFHCDHTPTVVNGSLSAVDVNANLSEQLPIGMPMNQSNIQSSSDRQKPLASACLLETISEAYKKTLSTSAITNPHLVMPFQMTEARTRGDYFDIDGTMQLVSKHIYGEVTMKKKSEPMVGEMISKTSTVVEDNSNIPSPSNNSITHDKAINSATTEIVSGSEKFQSARGTEKSRTSIASHEEFYHSEFDESEDDHYSSCGSSLSGIDSDEDDDEEEYSMDDNVSEGHHHDLLTMPPPPRKRNTPFKRNSKAKRIFKV
jgi:hypothetical protein